jgi:hypothetical protein
VAWITAGRKYFGLREFDRCAFTVRVTDQNAEGSAVLPMISRVNLYETMPVGREKRD